MRNNCYFVAVCDLHSGILLSGIFWASEWKYALLDHYMFWCETEAKRDGCHLREIVNEKHIEMIRNLPSEIEAGKERYRKALLSFDISLLETRLTGIE